jgi:hypothetical protein
MVLLFSLFANVAKEKNINKLMFYIIVFFNFKLFLMIINNELFNIIVNNEEPF